MSDLVQQLEFVRELERLKNTTRTAWTSSGRHESTAEHSWRLAMLAAVLLPGRPGLNAERVLLLCLIHDLGEAYDGDISAALLPDPTHKRRLEQAAVLRLTQLLPPAQKTSFLALWEEYEACTTLEARFVKALDKAETILQHNQGSMPPDFDYAFNLNYGSSYFENDALLCKLRRLLDAETSARLAAPAGTKEP